MLSHKKCGIGCCLQQHHKGLVSVGLEQEEGGLARECVCVHVCVCVRALRHQVQLQGPCLAIRQPSDGRDSGDASLNVALLH